MSDNINDEYRTGWATRDEDSPIHCYLGMKNRVTLQELLDHFNEHYPEVDPAGLELNWSTIVWERPATEEEKADRARRQEAHDRRHAEWEKMTYAKLKAKFEGDDQAQALYEARQQARELKDELEKAWRTAAELRAEIEQRRVALADAFGFRRTLTLDELVDWAGKFYTWQTEWRAERDDARADAERQKERAIQLQDKLDQLARQLDVGGRYTIDRNNPDQLFRVLGLVWSDNAHLAMVARCTCLPVPEDLWNRFKQVVITDNPRCPVHGKDFYEEDEPIEKIEAAFEAGQPVITAPPAPRTWEKYEDVPKDVQSVTGADGLRWERTKPRENVWRRVYPDGMGSSTVSPYDDRMMPCTEVLPEQ